LSEATGRPDLFIGMHWMNPVVIMPLIEIVKGAKTSEETVKKTIGLCGRYGKETVMAQKDVWFFLSARAQAGWHMDSALMVHNGRATVQEIDAMARYKLGLAMGPFEVADLTGAAEIRVKGLASVKKVLNKMPDFEPWADFLAVFTHVVEEFWKPMMEKGLTGVKAGKGFYSYPWPGKFKKAHIPEDAGDKVRPVEALACAINTSAWCVTNSVGSVDDVERCFRRAYNWPKGVFELAREHGYKNIIRELENKQKAAEESIKGFYEPDPLILKWAEEEI
jgi:enoyl-CoA hydratase/3-hydroxyacyl-CoA dehydrogenase